MLASTRFVVAMLAAAKAVPMADAVIDLAQNEFGLVQQSKI